MRKRYEVNCETSCFNKAKEDEMLFVLLGRDSAAPATISFWIAERIRQGKNKHSDPQIIEAMECAITMESQNKIYQLEIAGAKLNANKPREKRKYVRRKKKNKK
jgi:hypothetical protein